MSTHCTKNSSPKEQGCHPPANYPWGSRELHVEDPDGNVLRLGSENKPNEPFGDWLDMRGIHWRRKPEGGWARVE